MFIRRCLVLLVLMFCYSQVSAEITLKSSFFSGWKYSVDGLDYTKVGSSGNGLRSAMYGNEMAQSHMEKYKSSKTWATITGIPGGFLIGWPLGGYIGGGEWKDEYTTMMVIGAPFAVLSMVLEASATRNLKKAVELYNGDDHALVLNLHYRGTESGHRATFFFGAKYKF